MSARKIFKNPLKIESIFIRTDKNGLYVAHVVFADISDMYFHSYEKALHRVEEKLLKLLTRDGYVGVLPEYCEENGIRLIER